MAALVSGVRLHLGDCVGIGVARKKVVVSPVRREKAVGLPGEANPPPGAASTVRHGLLIHGSQRLGMVVKSHLGRG